VSSRLVYDDSLSEWAAKRMGIENPFGPCRAVGVENGSLLAVCVYHNWVPEHKRCEISFAAESPRWVTRGIIRELLWIPFGQYGLETVYTYTESSNIRALRFNEGIGISHPVEIEDYAGPGKNVVVRHMKKHEFLERYMP
jgi:RimJ/RimL family protein N-acetyltransferase